MRRIDFARLSVSAAVGIDLDLGEDLIHDLGSLSERRADLVPVHKFRGRRSIMPNQQSDAFYGHTVSR